MTAAAEPARWHRPEDLLGLPGMPAKSLRSIYLRAQKGAWRKRGARGATELHEADLPPATRAALAANRHAEIEPPADTRPAGPPPEPAAATAPGARAPHTAVAGRAPGPEGAAYPPSGPRGLPLAGPRAARAEARLWLLQAWEDWRAGRDETVWNSQISFCAAYTAGALDAPAAVRALYPALAWNTLQGWRKLLRESGIDALSGGRGNPRARSQIDADPAVAEYLAAAVFEYPHWAAARLHDALAARFPDKARPSLRALQRWLARFRTDNARALSAVANPDRHRSRRMPAFGDAAAGIARLNQMWEADSSPCDLICTDGRMTLVAGLDVFCRGPAVAVAPSSSAEAVAALLRRLLLDLGVPEAIRMDNGADYTSIRITRVLADLGVRTVLCQKDAPDQKPFIERFFRRLQHELIETLPGFCGHDVAQAQALRSRKSHAARRGEDAREAFQVALTAAALQARIDAWIRDVYMHTAHKGLGGKTPFQVRAAWRAPVKRIENEHALDILLAEAPGGHGIRTVSKHGLDVDGHRYIAAELGPLVGEKVQVRLHPDLGRIRVFDPFGERFLCDAVAPALLDVDRREIAIRAKKLAKAADKAARAEARRLKSVHRPQAIAEALAERAQAEAAKLYAFPASHAPHETPALAACADAADGVRSDSDWQPPAAGPLEAEIEDLAAKRAAAARAEAERLNAEAERVLAAWSAETPEQRRRAAGQARPWDSDGT